MIIKKSIQILVLFIITLAFITAHQPRIVYQQQLSIKSPLLIENPEISQAFYAELKNAPEYYRIRSAEEFNLYLNILSPDIKNSEKDFSVKILGRNISLNGENFRWTNFYEEFAGDNYWKGPEYENIIEPGEYIIRVSSPDNKGKYVLAVGKIESFSFRETISTLLAMPKLKIYFEKSILTSFSNVIGLFLLISMIFIGSIVFLVFFIKRKISKKKRLIYNTK